MLRKYYTADVIQDGATVGYVHTTIWGWQSPNKAINAMSIFAEARGCQICQIRRLT